MLEMIFSHSYFSFFHNLPFREEALKAQSGSDGLSLCHKVISLVSEQICPGVIRCKMLHSLARKWGIVGYTRSNYSSLTAYRIILDLNLCSTFYCLIHCTIT